MVYSIDSMHLNNGHMYPTQFMQIFGSAFCVQQLIIPARLNQIYIVAHRWKEEIISFPTMCHSSKFKGSSYDRSSTCERKMRSESILYLRLVLIDQRYCVRFSTFNKMFSVQCELSELHW